MLSALISTVLFLVAFVLYVASANAAWVGGLVILGLAFLAFAHSRFASKLGG